MHKLLPFLAALLFVACAPESSPPDEAVPALDASPDVAWPCGAKPAEGGCLCAADCPQKAPCHGFDVCENGKCGGDPTPEQCTDAGI